LKLRRHFLADFRWKPPNRSDFFYIWVFNIRDTNTKTSLQSY
jgi:hypothetical protein